MAMPGVAIASIVEKAPSPSYVVDLGRIRHNLAILDRVQRESGATVLMALKAFAMWSVFPLIAQTLSGVCASSPWEARLGREQFGKEVHSFAAAFKSRMLQSCWSCPIIWFLTPLINWNAFVPSGNHITVKFLLGFGLIQNIRRDIRLCMIPARPVHGLVFR